MDEYEYDLPDDDALEWSKVLGNEREEVTWPKLRCLQDCSNLLHH